MGSMCESTECTAIFDRDPASRAMALITTVPLAQAEYYIACPEQEVVWIDGSHQRPHHSVKKSTHKKYAHTYHKKTSHHKRSSYSINVSYPAYPCGGCMAWSTPYRCGPCAEPLNDVIVESDRYVTYDEPRRFHYVNQDEDINDNQDMATGDDDAMVHPGMQIN